MRILCALALLAAAASGAAAASLDVTAAYDMKAASYSHLDLGSSPSGPNDHSLLESSARLGIAARGISLESLRGGETTLDVGVLFHAIGVAGSSAAVAAPFDRAAAYYQNADFVPFLENAYLRVNHLWGLPWEATFGRQSYRLGSGLLLSDDGAGLTGAVVRADLPWGGMKVDGFIFQDHDPQTAAPNSLSLFGFSLGLPTDGLWQLNELVEREQGQQIVYGCGFAGDGDPIGCDVSKALRSFTSLRYTISYGPIFFDGEAAIEKGAATPDGATPSPNHVTYDGNAEVMRLKWKQPLYHMPGEGVARVTLARASGDKAGTQTTDEAFFPAHGARYDGLERTGLGDFYGATPYDALGGNFTGTTRSGLAQGVSGITTVGLGYTPPAYRGFALDFDFYLYQADQVPSGPRSLGDEYDLRLRYPIRDAFSLNAGFAYFHAGPATDPNRDVARKLSFEVKGRF